MWALDDEKVKGLVNRCYRFYPRAAAARMVRIVYLYYRAGQTAGQVAHELKMTLGAVEKVIARINKAANRPARPVGRPKKIGGGIGTTMGA